MLRYFTALLLLVTFTANAQTDSLFVTVYKDRWTIEHKVSAGETIFTISRKYHAPLAAVAGMNGMTYENNLQAGAKMYIPLGSYNQLPEQPASDGKKLYFRVGEYDNLFRISKLAGVQQRKMQQWNNLPDNSIETGQVLMVGWLLYDGTDVTEATRKEDNLLVHKPAPVQKKETKPVAWPKPKKDTIIVIQMPKKDTLSPIERLYMTQTNNGQNIVEEKGTATFFDMGNKSSGKFYAFHNQAKRGTIIKVHNPGQDKTIYVKVIGTIPETKQYHNSIIGMDDDARRALMVSDAKGWCELSYSGN